MHDRSITALCEQANKQVLPVCHLLLHHLFALLVLATRFTLKGYFPPICTKRSAPIMSVIIHAYISVVQKGIQEVQS